MATSQIISYCHIKNNSVFVNGKYLYDLPVNEDLTVVLAELYKQIPLNYPKFFKMDQQCKLGILATEFLIRNTADYDTFDRSTTALVFSNNASSLESDRKHLKTISDKENYFPSPAVFVYTLANIVMGEIAIKHKISGENAFFISEKFDPELMYRYCDILLEQQLATTIVAGWVNVDGKSAEAFVYCLKNLNFKGAKSGQEMDHSSQNIQQLYVNNHASRTDHHQS